MNLESKLAMVSGAASGLGRALALELAAEGCRLVLTDIDEVGLAETARLAVVPATIHRLDVSDRVAVHALAAQIERDSGVPDIVINNAGVACQQSLKDISYEDFEWVMSINFWGMVYGSKAFLDGMLKRGSGTIVNISSCMAFIALPNSGAYCSSKFAIRGFTETLRTELHGTGVQAISVHPGTIRTGLARNMRFHVGFAGDTDRDRFIRMLEQNSTMTAEYVARSIVRGIEKGRARVVVGKDSHFFDWLTRLLPGCYESIALPLMKWSLRD